MKMDRTELQKQADENIDELMNKLDRLTFFKILPSIKTTPDMNLKIIRKYPSYFESISAKDKTYEMCMCIIECGRFRNPLERSRIPKRFWDNELLASCVKNSADYSSALDIWNCILQKSPGKRSEKEFWETMLREPNAITVEKALEEDIFERYGFDLCDIISRNGLSLKGVSKSMQSEELYETAVKSNGLALEFVPVRKRSSKLCELALRNNPFALRYCPKRCWTEDAFFKVVFEAPDLIALAPAKIRKCISWSDLIERNWRFIAYAPAEYISIEQAAFAYQKILDIREQMALRCNDRESGWKDTIRKDQERQSEREFLLKIAQNLPEEAHNDKKIISLERRLKLRTYVSRTFDSERRVYFVDEKFNYIKKSIDSSEYLALREAGESYFHIDGCNYDLCDGAKVEHHEFSSFDDFLSYCGGDLEGVGQDILLSRELDDGTFYNRTILSWMNAGNADLLNEEASDNLSAVSDEAIQLEFLRDFKVFNNESARKIYYISDIHLMHKLAKKFPDGASKLEIQAYICELVKNMFQDNALERIRIQLRPDVLLIGGDTASNFEIAELFYEAVSDTWHGLVITVLGNHDLWSFSNLESAYQKYRELFQRLGGNFISLNGLLLYDTILWKQYISQSKLKDANPVQLKNLALRSSLILFGGTGFSGKNSTFNAKTGFIYRQAMNREDDIRETENFESAYNKLLGCLGDETVVVLTHTPKEDWSSAPYHPGWIYVNGHTHRNYYRNDDKMIVYADNQIGYKRVELGLKYFYLSKYCDIFRFYKDGVYSISRADYLDYLNYIGSPGKFKDKDGEVLLLKRSGFSCFISRRMDNRRIYLLNGGVLNTLSHDIDYYYENMEYYAKSVNETLKNYYAALNHIAGATRAIGGSGKIHGSIVDIDFYNHIFLNPLDGSITPYYALDMIRKFSYPSLEKLLLEQAPELHENYIKALNDNGKADKLAIFRQGNLKNSEYSGAIFVGDTSMYSLSRIMRSYQYLRENNLIRRWDDALISKMRMLAENQKEISD